MGHGFHFYGNTKTVITKQDSH